MKPHHQTKKDTFDSDKLFSKPINYFHSLFSKVLPSILILSKSFIYQLMHNSVAVKNIKIYIKTAPTCFGSITIIRERII